MAQHGAETLFEVRASPLGEGQREHALVLLQRADLMSRTMREDLCLAAARRRNDQQMVLVGSRRV